MDYAFLRAVVSDAVCTQFLCMLLLLAPAACKEHVFLDSFEEVSVAGGYDEIEGKMQKVFAYSRPPCQEPDHWISCREDPSRIE